MPQIISLYGPPGSGKSTAAAALYLHYKHQHQNVEMVREYVKDWAWQNKPIQPHDISYITLNQAYSESILLGKVDIIITDSPIYLNAYYAGTRGKLATSLAIAKEQDENYTQFGYTVTNLLVRRVHSYMSKGRYHTEEESDQIGKEVEQFLIQHNIPYTEVAGDTKEIISLIERV